MDRCKGIPVEFEDLMQADFILFLRSSMTALDTDSSQWWPETLLYAPEYRGPFEVFARARSHRFFDRIKRVLGAKDKEDLGRMFEGFAAKKIYNPHWEYRSLSSKRLMGYEELATAP